MAKYLTQEWLDRGKELAKDQPDRPGASIRLQYNITGGPDGDIKYWSVIEDGHVIDQQIGELDDAEVTLTETFADAESVQKGELDATAAFMQGRVKVGGNMGKLMSLLPLTNSPEYKQLMTEITAETEF